jgi:hypothetical protein
VDCQVKISLLAFDMELVEEKIIVGASDKASLSQVETEGDQIHFVCVACRTVAGHAKCSSVERQMALSGKGV